MIEAVAAEPVARDGIGSSTPSSGWDRPIRPVPGPIRFARYAYGPNSLGYCGPDEAICEQGGYCTGGVCEPKLLPLQGCAAPHNCRTAECVNMGPAGNRCDEGYVCFWAWDEKAPS